MAQSYSHSLRKEFVEHLSCVSSTQKENLKKNIIKPADLKAQLETYINEIETRRKRFVADRRECDMREIECESINPQKWVLPDVKEKNTYQ